MTDVYEFSEFERENLVYDFVTLITRRKNSEKKLNYAKFEAEKAAQKAAAAAAAAAKAEKQLNQA